MASVVWKDLPKCTGVAPAALNLALLLEPLLPRSLWIGSSTPSGLVVGGPGVLFSLLCPLIETLLETSWCGLLKNLDSWGPCCAADAAARSSCSSIPGEERSAGAPRPLPCLCWIKPLVRRCLSCKIWTLSYVPLGCQGGTGWARHLIIKGNEELMSYRVTIELTNEDTFSTIYPASYNSFRMKLLSQPFLRETLNVSIKHIYEMIHVKGLQDLNALQNLEVLASAFKLILMPSASLPDGFPSALNKDCPPGA